MRFKVSDTVYEFDMAPEKLMGDELLLLDEHLRPGWAQRWANFEMEPRDIVVLTYLAAKRAGEERPFAEFAKTIAPLTFKPVSDSTPLGSKRPAARAKTKAAPLDGPLGPMVRERKQAKSAAS